MYSKGTTTTNRRLRTATKEEIKMKQGGFIVNGRPYQFFSKERTFVNRLLNLGTTRRGGFWNSSNKGGRGAKRKGGVWWNFSDKDFRENLRRAGQKKGGHHHNKWDVPKQREKK